MPYKSEAQRRFFNANRAELEAQGVSVDEFNEASRGKKLPERKAERKPPRKKAPRSRSPFDFMKRQPLEKRMSGKK